MRRRAEQDAGQVVVAKHHRLLDRAGGDDHLAGAQFIESVAAHHGEPVVGEPAGAGGARHDLDVGRGLDRGAETGAVRRAIGEAGVAERAAELGVLVDQQHVEAGVGRLERRRHPGRPAADHGDVGEAILLVVIAVLGQPVDRAEAGQLPDHRLPELPGALRLVEGAVIEADRQEAAERAQQAAAVIAETARIVLSHHLQARRDRCQIGQHVGRVRQLHQGVGVLAGHAERAARAVVLERAGQHPLVVRQQRRGDRVAGKALVASALEAELDRPVVIDPGAGAVGEAGAHGGASGGAKATRSANNSLAG